MATTTDWIQAWAGIVVAATAVAALFYAWRQIRLAVRTRDDVTQPFVVAYLESEEIDPQFVDLVIKNFGATPLTTSPSR